MPLLLLAIGPGIFWLWYFLAKDRLRPEPRSLVRRVFFVGVIAAFAAGLLEAGALGAAGLSLEAGMPETLIAAAFIGLIEEGVKFAAVLVTAYRHTHFDEVIDGIVYAVTASLGFATIENVFYVFNGGVGVGVARALLSVPGHAFFGAVMGYYLEWPSLRPTRPAGSSPGSGWPRWRIPSTTPWSSRNLPTPWR
jgi:RsiW-degrading membrane proteinase PrsW (M82 family)